MDNLFLNEQTSEQTWQEPNHSPSPKINRVHVASQATSLLGDYDLLLLPCLKHLHLHPPEVEEVSEESAIMTMHVASLIHDKLHNDLWLNDRSFFALLLLLSSKTETNILFYHLKFIPQVLICVPVPRRATPNLHKNLLFGVHRCKWFWMSSWSLTTIK